MNAALGVLILVSPWAAGYEASQQAVANAVIAGTLLFTVALLAAVTGLAAMEWGCAGLGGWMIASPWALAFADAPATRMAVWSGCAALLLGAGALVSEWRHPGRAPGPWRP